MAMKRSSLSLLALSIALAGCAMSSEQHAQADPAREPALPAEFPVALDASPFDQPPEEIRYGHFSADVLQRLILAEMAGQRGRDDEAVAGYLALARETRDLGIIQRASRIATFLRMPEAAIEMTQLWLEHEPESPEAYQTLALQLLAMGNYEDALSHLVRLQRMGHDVDFRMIVARTGIDRQSSRLIPRLINEFETLLEDFPDQRSLRLSLAQLYEQDGRPEEALELIHQLALDLNNAPDIVALEARLLEQLNRRDEVRSRLRDGLKAHPESRQLRFLLGRQLVSLQDFEGASEQFAAIIERDPDDHEIVYSLALINLEMNHLHEAARHFEHLLKAGFRLDDIHYYLGFIKSQDGDREAAINHFKKIKSGSNFLQAQRDLTQLLVQDDRYQEARQRLQRLRYTNPEYNLPLLSMEAGILLEEKMYDDAASLLNSAIAAFPNNVQLLYLRSVLSTERNDLALMEQDLRRIIELEPDNPVAYNSLGYVLADRTDRHEEAYALIRKAIELSPDDPAVIDSLGWVQYRLGRLDEARENLERAFRLYPDHEVAAHLGEVLWMMGERRAANRVWQEGLEDTPDSQYIHDAMERLVPGAGD